MNSREEGSSPVQDPEQTWNLFINNPKRTIRQIFDLVVNPGIQTDFQQRAIRTLLDLSWASFDDNELATIKTDYFSDRKYDPIASGAIELTVGPRFKNVAWIQELDDSQAQYVAEILPSYLEKEYEKDIFRYNHYQSVLLDLLPKLSEEQAKKLFENFDFANEWNGVSGILALFQRSHRYDSWKIKTVGELHKRIQEEAEENGAYRLRKAAYWYAEFLGKASDNQSVVFPGNGDRNQNRADFFGKEIAYAMSIIHEYYLIRTDDGFLSILDRLPEELRHDFVRRHINVLSNTILMRKLIETFPDDIEMVIKLREQIKKYTKKEKNPADAIIGELEFELRYESKRTKEEVEEKAEEERIMRLMMKPSEQEDNL